LTTAAALTAGPIVAAAFAFYATSEHLGIKEKDKDEEEVEEEVEEEIKKPRARKQFSKKKEKKAKTPAPVPDKKPAATAESSSEPAEVEKKKKKKKKPKASAQPQTSESQDSVQARAKPEMSPKNAGDQDDGFTMTGSKKSKNKHKNKHKEQEQLTQTTEAAKDADEDVWETVEKKGPKKKPQAAEISPADEHITVEVDTEGHKASVIGKKGAKINELQQKYGATLSIDRESSLCRISGKRSQVEQAERAIRDIVDSEKDTLAKRRVIHLDVIGNKIAVILGKGGTNIKKITAQSGAKVDIIRSTDKSDKTGENGTTADADPATNVVKVTGTEEQVNKAKAMIEELIGHGADEPEVRQTVELGSQANVFVILGKGGSRIRELTETTGAKLVLPPRENGTEGEHRVHVSGTAEQVERACAKIRTLIEDQDMCTVDITEHIGLVIGKGGSTIRQIQAQSGARLDIEKDDFMRILKITGTSAQVAAAKAAVEASMETSSPTLQAGEVSQEMVLGEYVGSVIGRQGSTVKRIQEEFKVKVEIIRHKKACNVIGAAGDVAKAKEAIDDILKRQRTFKQREETHHSRGAGNSRDGGDESSQGGGGASGGWGARSGKASDDENWRSKNDPSTDAEPEDDGLEGMKMRPHSRSWADDDDE